MTATNIAIGASTAYCRQLYLRYHKKLDVGSHLGRKFMGTTHAIGYKRTSTHRRNVSNRSSEDMGWRVTVLEDRRVC